MGCYSPQARVTRLERALLALLASKPAFTIKAGKDTIQLPLPADHAFVQRLKTAALRWGKQARKIPAGELMPGQQDRLSRLQAVLDSLARPDHVPAHTPENYMVHDVLGQMLSPDKGIRHPELLTTVVENLPGYFEQVTRQQPTGATGMRAFSLTLEAAKKALSLLDAVEHRLPELSIGYRERLRKALAPARWAIKDYVAWVDSTRMVGGQ
ncbi:MAG: hypothetical protein SFV52_08030 [Saprospiraceae bacterium]|nr:hypothetical protein [Saprospiraceae bacterium]